MFLLLHIIVTYIKENIITKLQRLYSLPRNPRAGSKSLTLFVKKPLCMGDISPVHKIFIERPVAVVVWVLVSQCRSPDLKLQGGSKVSLSFHHSKVD